MALDGISIVTAGLMHDAGGFPERITTHGLVGSYGTSISSVIVTYRRLLLLLLHKTHSQLRRHS